MVHGRALPWISDVVPALGGLAIHFDPDEPSVHGDALAAALNVVRECLKEGLPKAGDGLRQTEGPRRHGAGVAPALPAGAATAQGKGGEASEVPSRSAFPVLVG